MNLQLESIAKHVVSWADIRIMEEGKETDKAIKRISMDITAGDLATLSVEEYTGEFNKQKTEALTKTTTYFLDFLKIDTLSEKRTDKKKNQIIFTNPINYLEI